MAALLMTLTPTELGILSGFIHHFAIQYPSQAAIFTTFFAFTLSNAVFATLWMIAGGPSGGTGLALIGRFSKDLCVFNAVYVCAIQINLTESRY